MGSGELAAGVWIIPGEVVRVGHGSYSEDLDKLETWADWKLTKAKKSKGKVLLLREEPAHVVMQAGGWLPWQQMHRKGCVVLGDTQLNGRQQCALAANGTNCILSCVSQSEASRCRKVTLSLWPL